MRQNNQTKEVCLNNLIFTIHCLTLHDIGKIKIKCHQLHAHAFNVLWMLIVWLLKNLIVATTIEKNLNEGKLNVTSTKIVQDKTRTKPSWFFGKKHFLEYIMVERCHTQLLYLLLSSSFAKTVLNYYIYGCQVNLLKHGSYNIETCFHIEFLSKTSVM